MSILIAGDFCPNDRIRDRIASGDYSFISPQIENRITLADYSILNLECPVVIDHDEPISKKGPNLKCTMDSVKIIKKMGFDCCTLANNHFRDYGDNGCEKTLLVLDQLSIDHLGGEMDLRRAQKILVKNIAGKRVAFVNFCENEFSIATEDKAGAAPLDMIENYYQIKKARNMADYVIVIVHGGHEHFPYPSFRMKKTYHWFAELGADVIVNHHQHCYCGFETYKGVPIFYGLGNFCFDWNGKRDSLWTEGVLLNLTQLAAFRRITL